MHPTMKSPLGRLLLVCVFVVLPERGPTLAATKILNAGACAGQNSLDPHSYDTSGLYNNGQNGHILGCALPRFNNTNTNGLSSLVVYLNTGDGGVGVNQCTAWSTHATGGGFFFVTKTAPSPANTDVSLDFGATLNVSDSTSSYFVACTTALHAVLRQIRYTEP
jgi:hypothetical protein